MTHLIALKSVKLAGCIVVHVFVISGLIKASSPGCSARYNGNFVILGLVFFRGCVPFILLSYN